MPITVECDGCAKKYRVPEDKAGSVIRCKECGATDEQLMEIFNVGLIVGGSIVIPHLRRAIALLDELNAEAK